MGRRLGPCRTLSRNDRWLFGCDSLSRTPSVCLSLPWYSRLLLGSSTLVSVAPRSTSTLPRVEDASQKHGHGRFEYDESRETATQPHERL